MCRTDTDREREVRLLVDEAGFVRAAPALVHRRLVDVGRWPDLGLAERVRPVGDDPDAWLIEVRGRRGRRLRWRADLHGWRPDQGFLMELEGDLQGRAEVWLEPAAGGTVVHHLLQARTARPHPDRVLADHRRAVRRGLWGLKDLLHLEARTSAGLAP